MGLKTFSLYFSELVTEKGIRNDFKYFDWRKNQKRVFESKIKLGKSLNSYYKGFAFKGDDFSNNGEIFVLKGINFNSDYSIDFNNIQYLSDDFFDNKKYANFKVSKDDIILSLVGSIGKITLIEEDYRMLLNQNNIALRPNKELFNLKYFTYIVDFLLKEIIKKLYANSGYSFLRIEDLFDIDLPFIIKTQQDKIVSQIEPIEKNIKNLKSQIKEPQEVINKVFAREFNFNLKKFEKLKKIKNYYLNLSDAVNNKDLRNSVTFHQESAQFVMSELKIVTKAKIKHFISEPIVLGASISPNNFNENGGYYYVSMATVKNYCLELDESQLVSTQYAKDNMNKSICKFDIIMTRSGVAIGKFAIIEEEVKGIFADFTMRIRLVNYNSLFAYYYFRSEYFQHLIHSNKKGLQNKNIFPSQIQEFPMIDISMKEQQRIVYEIKTELDKQEDYKKIIGNERNKIDKIIENAIK